MDHYGRLSKMAQGRKSAALVASTLALLSLAALFFTRNKAVPTWDYANYFVPAQKIYLIIQAQGILAGIKALYWVRTYKPILHPIIGVPFLLLTHGNILSAGALSSGFFYLLVLCLLGKILLRRLPPVEASIALLFLGSTSWLTTSAVLFFSEIYFIFFFLSFVYLLNLSQSLSQWKTSVLAGLMFGLTACCRPVEAALILSVPLTILLLSAYRRRALGLVDTVWLFFSFTSAAALFGFVYFSRQDSLVPYLPYFFVFYVLGCIAYIKRVQNPKAWARVGFATAALWLPLLWFAPFIGSLYFWISQATFGFRATSDGRMLGLGGRIAYLWSVFRELGGVPVAIFCALGAIGSRQWIRERPSRFFFGLVSLAIPVLLGSCTFNPDPRYFLGLSILVSIIALGWALAPGGNARTFRVGVVVLICAAQLFTVTATMVSNPKKAEFYTNLVPGPWFRLEPWTQSDPAEFVVERLISSHALKNPSVFAVLWLPFGDQRDDLYDDNSLTVLSRARSQDWTYYSLQEPGKTLTDEIRWLKEMRVDYLIVETGSPQHPRKTENCSKAGLELLRAHFTPEVSIPWISKDGFHSDFAVYRAAALEILLAGRRRMNSPVD